MEGLGYLAEALAAEENLNFEVDQLSDDEYVELMGAIQRLPLPQKKTAFSKIKTAATRTRPQLAVETRYMTAKSLFEKRLNMIEDLSMRRKLQQQKWQINDHVLYSTKLVGGRTNAEMFEAGDRTNEGLTNLVQGRLQKDEYFLCTGIRVLSGVGGASSTIDDAGSVNFGVAADPIVNGEYTFKNDQVTFASKNSALCFKHSRTDLLTGYYQLDVPKMLHPGKAVVFDMDFASAAVAETFLRVELYGAITMKA